MGTNIILTGSLAIDRIMNFPGYFKEHILPDKIHALNVSFNIERLEEKRGGTAGNIAYTLSMLGETPKIVASAGNDFGLYLNALQGLHLPIDGIEIQDDVTTASAYIITDMDDNQITGFNMGAMAVETHADLAVVNPEDTIVVLSPGNKMDMLKYADVCRARGIRFVFDPGQTLPFLEPEEIPALVEGAYIIFVNDYELEMIHKRTGLSAEMLLEKAEMLITTFGKKGSTIRLKDATIDIPVCSVQEVVDPTGAGDAYRAGFLKGLAIDGDLEQVGKIAATAAAYAVEKVGTQEHFFTLERFCTRYKEAFSETCPLT